MAEGSLGFTPLAPAPDVAFWQALTQKKLDVLRLDTSAIQIHGYYEAPAQAGAPEKCFLHQDSLEVPGHFPVGRTPYRGELSNFNTVEDFKDFLKSEARGARVNDCISKLRDQIVDGKVLDDPALLRPIIAITFSDLKKYHYTFTVAFPVISPSSPWQVSSPSLGALEAGFSREFMCKLSQDIDANAELSAAGAFILKKLDADWERHPLSALRDCSSSSSSDDFVIVAIDSSSRDEALGSPCRNLMLAVSFFCSQPFRILAFRDPHLAAKSEASAVASRVFHVKGCQDVARTLLESPTLPKECVIAGWSKIQTIDLTTFMDKKRVAADAVDLNVKLIKWRILPELEPMKMKELRFLLVGSGTLGCSLARTLMGWGVRKMTFIDAGKVSFSNPVRQSLFTHADAAEGRSKAKAAREAVEAIMPDAELQDVELEVPMPGHPHQSADALKATVQKLRSLVEAHDVVCMLTDSRESRWLPSLLVAAAQRKALAEAAAVEGSTFDPPPRSRPPLGLTVALGFDSFLVQRQTYLNSPAACYFCNDVTAPRDSLAFRTLDQQCTVTRPGLSGISSGIAVELIAALVQHQDGFAASATGSPSCLGTVPHQIRGFLSDFKISPMETEPFANCICCSRPVLERYEQEGDDFIARITVDSSELEEISGLAKMKAGLADADCLAFDFDEDESDEN